MMVSIDSLEMYPDSIRAFRLSSFLSTLPSLPFWTLMLVLYTLPDWSFRFPLLLFLLSIPF